MSDSDSDSDIDEEAIAAERAALRAASSAADAPLPPPAAAPSASADALGGRRGASSSERQNAAKRALELNLQFQQMCQDELKSIAVSLRLNEAAREQAKRAFQICASLQNRVDGRSAAGKAVRAGAPARGIDLDDAKPRCRLDFVPFFSCPRNGITDQPEPNEDARWKEELDRSFPNAPSVKGWSREERLDLRCAIAGQLKHEYHKQLLQRMQDAATPAERAEAKQLLHAFTTADTEGDAFLKERQSAQEAMGMPLGTDGTPLAWARVQVPPPLLASPRALPSHPAQPIPPAAAHAPPPLPSLPPSLARSLLCAAPCRRSARRAARRSSARSSGRTSTTLG